MAPTGTSPVPTWKRNPSRRTLPAGFTLIELAVVLALIGLATGLVAVRLRQPYRDAKCGDAVERIVLTDGQVRAHARRFARPSKLIVDLDANALYAGSSGTGDGPRFRTAVSGGVRLDRACTSQERISSGRMSIAVTPQGQTPSYAVRVAVGDRQTRWLVFSGVTGQVSRLEEEGDVQKVFQWLGRNGPDAD